MATKYLVVFSVGAWTNCKTVLMRLVISRHVQLMIYMRVSFKLHYISSHNNYIENWITNRIKIQEYHCCKMEK